MKSRLLFLSGIAALALSLPLTAQLEPDSEPVSLGPLGGSVAGIAADPTTPDTLLVIEYVEGLMRSTDAGRTVVPYGTGLPATALGLVTDPTNPQVLYSHESDRLYRSSDFGATWASTTPPPTSDGLSNVAVSSTGDVLVHTAYEVFRSTDGGTTWTTSLSPGGSPSLSSITYAPGDPSVAYVGFIDGLYRSTDGGASFTLAGPWDEWVQAITVDPSDADVVLAGTPFAGLNRSTDGGATFSLVNSPVTGGNSEFFSWEPDGGLWYGMLDALVYSADGGLTWVDKTPGLEQSYNPIPYAMAYDVSGKRYVGGTGGGLYDSSGGGLYEMPAGPVTSWTHAGYQTARINDVAVAGPGGERLIGIGSGVYSAPAGEGLFPTGWHADLGTDTRAVAVDPTDPDRWLTGGVGAFIDNAQVVVVSNDGQDFVKTYERWSNGVVTDIEFAPGNPDVVVAGIFPGVFGSEALIRSTDGGNSWTPVPGTGGWASRAIAFDPHTPGRVLQLSDNGLSDESLDGGLTWSTSYPTWISSGMAMLLEIDPLTPGRLYRGDTVNGLWRSDDNGATWNLLGVALTPESDLALHPEFPGLLWVSDASGHVLVSANAGNDFAIALDVPLDKNAAALALDTLDGSLLVGTNGAATFELPAASPAVKLGDGTAGSGGIVPRLVLGGRLPRIGTPDFRLVGDGILGGAQVYLALSATPTATSAFGGTFHVGDPFILVPLVAGGPSGVPGAGGFLLQGAIPNDPGYVGITAYLQYGVEDAGTAHVDGIALSDGMSITFLN